jgi:Leucine-rich repeat (LRR) protein
LILLGVGIIAGRQLECYYLTSLYGTLWPYFQYCSLSYVSLSKSFETQWHSFSGSSLQKSATTVVWFSESTEIDFIPKEIPKEYPNLNGLGFDSCNLPVVKNDLISEDFRVLEHLDLGYNPIVSIEPLAFQHLKNLKWLRLCNNKIQSLPINLFQNNPKLIYLDFDDNPINSISPDFLKNLNVEFR